MQSIVSFLLGRAFLALGRKEDALLVWEKGYEHALRESADLKQLLELEELLKVAKQDTNVNCENPVIDSRPSVSTAESGTHVNGKVGQICENLNKFEICEKLENLNKSDSTSSSYEPSDMPKICIKSRDNADICNEISHKVNGGSSMPESESGIHINGKSSEASKNCNGLNDISKITYGSSESSTEFNLCNGFSDKANANEKLNGQMNGTHDISDKSRSDSEFFKELKTTNLPHGKSPLSCSNTSDTSEEVKRDKKFGVTRNSKTKSISVDFRLSRGIAQVFFGICLRFGGQRKLKFVLN